MQWSSFIEVLKDDEVFAILLWVSFGFALREQFSTAAYEWSVLTGRRRRRWIHVIYFGAKIAYWCAISTSIVSLYTVHRVDCEALFYAIKALLALSTVASSTLLACRAAVVHNERRTRCIAVALLTVFGVGVAASWFYQITRISAFWVPRSDKPWTEGSCILPPIHSSEVIAPAVTAAFDFMVLLIVLHGIYRLDAEHTVVGKRLLRHNIIYVIIILLLNAISLGFLIADLNPVMSLILTWPLITASILLSTRLHVELAESVGTPTGAYVGSPPDSDPERRGESKGQRESVRSGDLHSGSGGAGAGCERLGYRSFQLSRPVSAPVLRPADFARCPTAVTAEQRSPDDSVDD